MLNSAIVNLPHPTAVVCHDAGSANHILAWLRSDNCAEYIQPYMTGPAQKIWAESFPNKPTASSMTEALTGAKSLLSGTGWASDLEHNARRLARKTGIKAVAMIDHWVNYENRFVREGVQLLPDEIWVVDDYAFDLARETFPCCQVFLKKDTYSQYLLAEVQPVSDTTGNSLLYILEPMRSNWGRSSQGEFQALDYMIENLQFLGLPEDTVVKLRPHPSDPLGKYDGYLTKQSVHLLELDQGSLVESLSESKWVAGCQSFALTLALKAERTVYCTLPPWGPPCRLPHKGLIHIKKLLHT